MNNFWHDLPRPFFILAPMEAVTDVVFRHVIAQAAPPDVWFTEFTNATGWAHAGDKAIGGRLVNADDEYKYRRVNKPQLNAQSVKAHWHKEELK